MKQAIRSIYGKLSSQQTIEHVELINANGLRLELLNYGARWLSLHAPDRYGKMADVLIGPNSLPELEHRDVYFGCIVGRYANRISQGGFSLNNTFYPLANNLNDEVHLHGGNKGFDKAIWEIALLEAPGRQGVRFTHLSKDGDEGYPGNVHLQVDYWLTDADEVVLNYQAETDQATAINLTNHAYFNLTGNPQQHVLQHQLKLYADEYTETDDRLVPTGVLASVAGTPLDFRQAKEIGSEIEADHKLIRIANGYDHNFVVRATGKKLREVAYVTDPQSGRSLDIFSTQPGVQLYTANWFDGSQLEKRAVPISKRHAFCLECQHFPDSPNQPDFPSTCVLPGQPYEHETVYRFRTATSNG